MTRNEDFDHQFLCIQTKRIDEDFDTFESGNEDLEYQFL